MIVRPPFHKKGQHMNTKLPLFEQFMPVDQLIASFGEFIPFIKTKLDVVLYNAFPFNLLKGLLITAFTMLVYKRIRPLLKGKD